MAVITPDGVAGYVERATSGWADVILITDATHRMGVRTERTRARAIAMESGIRYAYTGNVSDSKGGSTYCHQCGEVLIERDWYDLGQWNLTDGKCRFCGTPCAGVFEGRPGTWGSRRLPVRMSRFA